MSALATCHIKSPIVPRTRLIKKKSRIAVRANYKITLITPGGDKTFECDDETYILDAAEEEGLTSRIRVVKVPVPCVWRD